MKLPFTPGQFLEVFLTYNQAIWPMQVLVYMAGLVALAAAVRKTRHGNKVTAAMLAILWLWNGAVYHLSYFSQINKAAYLFGIVFVLHGLFSFYSGFIRRNLAFAFKANAFSVYAAADLLITFLYKGSDEGALL
jgi:hypothetical protein